MLELFATSSKHSQLSISSRLITSSFIDVAQAFWFAAVNAIEDGISTNKVRTSPPSVPRSTNHFFFSAWQTAGRQRQSNSSSRTPQNRSGTASPNQQNPSQPPRQEPARTQPANNVWTQRNSGTGSSNGQPRTGETSQGNAEQSVNGFNAAQVKAFLSRDAGVEPYKPADGSTSARASGGAWGAKREYVECSQCHI